jgi:transglutaminase-like putative cysteine protease
LNARRLDAPDTTSEQLGRLEISQAIKKAALEQGAPYVLPHHFACTMTVTTKPNAAPPGQTIRAWLPIPRQLPFQDGFELSSATPPPKFLAPADSDIRSVYMEQRAASDGSAKFEIAYTYTTRGVYFGLQPEKIRRSNVTASGLAPFVKEAPHVVFTEPIRTLARQLVGSETNPMLQAKAFYDWIGGNVKYSFAREYSTLTNLSDYCLSHRYGDCGQEALLFITLCRWEGIPARWQTGWDVFPGAKDIHDWTEIYLDPYGWVPVDPWAGLFAAQYCPALTPAQRQELHDFYFGGLDYYRMAANGAHNQRLEPPKNTLRSDDVDFQRGELEWSGGNIYFDKYSYDLSVQELK